MLVFDVVIGEGTAGVAAAAAEAMSLLVLSGPGKVAASHVCSWWILGKVDCRECRKED
jgi:hypothetical protein